MSVRDVFTVFFDFYRPMFDPDEIRECKNMCINMGMFLYQLNMAAIVLNLPFVRDEVYGILAFGENGDMGLLSSQQFQTCSIINMFQLGMTVQQMKIFTEYVIGRGAGLIGVRFYEFRYTDFDSASALMRAVVSSCHLLESGFVSYDPSLEDGSKTGWEEDEDFDENVDNAYQALTLGSSNLKYIDVQGDCTLTGLDLTNVVSFVVSDCRFPRGYPLDFRVVVGENLVVFDLSDSDMFAGHLLELVDGLKNLKNLETLSLREIEVCNDYDCVENVPEGNPRFVELPQSVRNFACCENPDMDKFVIFVLHGLHYDTLKYDPHSVILGSHVGSQSVEVKNPTNEALPTTFNTLELTSDTSRSFDSSVLNNQRDLRYLKIGKMNVLNVGATQNMKSLTELIFWECKFEGRHITNIDLPCLTKVKFCACNGMNGCFKLMVGSSDAFNVNVDNNPKNYSIVIDKNNALIGLGALNEAKFFWPRSTKVLMKIGLSGVRNINLQQYNVYVTHSIMLMKWLGFRIMRLELDHFISDDGFIMHLYNLQVLYVTSTMIYLPPDLIPESIKVIDYRGHMGKVEASEGGVTRALGLKILRLATLIESPNIQQWMHNIFAPDLKDLFLFGKMSVTLPDAWIRNLERIHVAVMKPSEILRQFCDVDCALIVLRIDHERFGTLKEVKEALGDILSEGSTHMRNLKQIEFFRSHPDDIDDLKVRKGIVKVIF